VNRLKLKIEKPVPDSLVREAYYNTFRQKMTTKQRLGRAALDVKQWNALSQCGQELIKLQHTSSGNYAAVMWMSGGAVFLNPVELRKLDFQNKLLTLDCDAGGGVNNRV
jgi:hypothetical protein